MPMSEALKPSGPFPRLVHDEERDPMIGAAEATGNSAAAMATRAAE